MLIRDITPLEYKGALDTLREYKRIEREGRKVSRSVATITGVYKAMDTVLSYAKNHIFGDCNFEGELHIRNRPLAVHFYQFADDVYKSLCEHKRLSMPSPMYLELMMRIAKNHDQVIVEHSTAMTSSHTSTIKTKIGKQTFGNDTFKHEPTNEIMYTPNYVMLTNWAYCENHVNDMVNFALATALVSKDADIVDAIVNNTSFK